jgi:hypothetical protein
VAQYASHKASVETALIARTNTSPKEYKGDEEYDASHKASVETALIARTNTSPKEYKGDEEYE